MVEAFSEKNIDVAGRINMDLDLGWSQGYDGLKYHMDEAYVEKNIDKAGNSCPKYAIFSQSYFNSIRGLNDTKLYDYCFIGSIDTSAENRQWVIDFAKQNFSNKSVFVVTDAMYVPWKSIGDFDISHRHLGFVPKRQIEPHVKSTQYRVVAENLFYFQTMRQSKYVLCPAGDTSWSFRFYETLMCGSLPVVDSWHHTYRTVEESKIPYKYILRSEIDKLSTIDYDDMVRQNTELFKQYHLLGNIDLNI